jgi:hypothetical protein
MQESEELVREILWRLDRSVYEVIDLEVIDRSGIEISRGLVASLVLREILLDPGVEGLGKIMDETLMVEGKEIGFLLS